MSVAFVDQDSALSILERSQLFEILDSEIKRAASERAMLGVVLLQIRNLGAINNEFGYRAADRVLEDFVNSLSQAWGDSHPVGRFSGSKVAIILPKIRGLGQVLLAANRIQESVKTIEKNDGLGSQLRIAVGGAVYPDHGENPDQLMRCAERAVAGASQNADGIQLFETREIEPATAELTLESELATDIDNGDVEMHYQPKIDLRSRRIVGVESLARWTSETHGRMSPEIYIGIAERSALILPLTMLTLNIALRHCMELRDSANTFTVAVNLSAATLNEPDIDQLVERALAIWGVEPGRLVLEVTESAMMNDPAAALAALKRLRAVGVRISIDDFGTGYSSLAYLKNLPVNELKIDKSFVMNMTDDDNDRKIVKSVIDLAHNFDLKVVAEGIENAESLELLNEMGCDHAQGFYLAKPMAFEDLLEWMARSPFGTAK